MSLYSRYAAAVQNLELRIKDLSRSEDGLEMGRRDSGLSTFAKDESNTLEGTAVAALNLCRQVLSLAKGGTPSNVLLGEATANSVGLKDSRPYRATRDLRKEIGRGEHISPFMSDAVQRAGLSKNLGKRRVDEVSDLRFKVNKLTAQRKVMQSRSDQTINILQGKLKAATQKNERYINVMQEQEAALHEQAEIIHALKQRLKRTWSQDPHITMSPRTKRIIQKFQSDSKLLKTKELRNENNSVLHEDQKTIEGMSHPGSSIARDSSDDPLKLVSSKLTCLAVHNISQGRLTSELFDMARLSNKGELMSVIIADESRQLVWIALSQDDATSHPRCVSNTVLPPLSKDAPNLDVSRTLESFIVQHGADKHVDGCIEWFPLRRNQNSHPIGYIQVCYNIESISNDTSRESIAHANNNWCNFASQIFPAIEMSVLLNRVDAVCSQIALRIPGMAKQGSMGPVWNLIETAARRVFDHTLEATIRLYDEEREELIRFKRRDRTPSQNRAKRVLQFDEVRHSIHDGVTTYNIDRSGRYRGYALQMIKANSRERRSRNYHPFVINRFDEDEDDCFVSFGKARAVLAVTMSGGRGQPAGILELCRQEGGAYTTAEEAACVHFVSRVHTMIIFAYTITRECRLVKQQKELQVALKPVSLSSLSGETELLMKLSLHSKQVLRAETSFWFLIDEENKCYRSKISSHGTEIVAKFGRGTILDLVRETKTPRCIKNVKACSDKDAQILNSSDYLNMVGDVITTLAVPILNTDGSVMGVAQVINKVGTAEPFDHIALELLTKIAEFASVAFQNFRLLDCVISQRGFALDHLEDLHSSSEVIESVIFNARRAVNADYAVLFLNPSIDEDKGKYLLLYDSDNSNLEGSFASTKSNLSNIHSTEHENNRWAMVSMNSLAGNCASTGSIINVLDARTDARRDPKFEQILAVHRGAEFKRIAVLCVPIIDPKGNVAGVVQVMNKRMQGGGSHGYFVPSDETKLKGLLAAAAVSIKSAMLHDTAEKSYKRLNRLLDVTKAVSREHDIHALLKRVLDAAQDVVGATKSSIWTIDHDTRELCSKFIVPNQEIRIPLSAGIAGAVASTGKFEHIPDAYKDSRFDQEVDRKTGNRTRNILCAPLISSHGATLGVVQVLNKHGGRSFTAEDINLIQAFASQAACSLENLQMFRHIHKLQEYANTVAPTSNSIALIIDADGHCVHSSLNPVYVLGISMEEMRSTGFPLWIGQGKGSKRNRELAIPMARILGDGSALHRARSISLNNYTYVSPLGSKILMNITLTPIFSNSFQVKGLNVIMTNIKRHLVEKVVEAHYNYGISNMIRTPWKPLVAQATFCDKLLPHRTMSTDMDDVLAAAEVHEAKQRLVMESGTLVTPSPRRVSMTMGSHMSQGILHSSRAAYKKNSAMPTFGEEADYSVHREVNESSCAVLTILMELVSTTEHSSSAHNADKFIDHPKPSSTTPKPKADNKPSIVESILKSSLNRSFGVGMKMRLHPEDFVHHFRLEAMLLVAEAGGFIDRSYPNVLVVSFGIRDADCEAQTRVTGPASSSSTDSIVTCCRVAMKLSLLAENFKQEMLQYEATRQNKDNLGPHASNRSTSEYLRTHIGVHSCSVPVSSLPSKENWQKANEKPADDGLSSSSNDETLDSTQVSEVLHDSSGLNSKIEGVEPKPILTEPAKSVTPPGETQDNDEDVLGAEVNSMLDDVLHARSSSAKLLAKESEFDSIFNNAKDESPTKDTIFTSIAPQKTGKDSEAVFANAENSPSHQGINTAQEKSPFMSDEDAGNLIYKIDDSHVDFGVELTWAARTLQVGVVLSPQAMVTIDRSSTRMKEIIVRDLDTMRSNAFLNRPYLKIFQLIAFEHLGSHDPGVLKGIRHYEKGLNAYRQKRFREAQISFQHALSVPSVLGVDGASVVMHRRCHEFMRKPPHVQWCGETELSHFPVVMNNLTE